MLDAPGWGEPARENQAADISKQYGESEDEAVAQARAFLGGSIWTYASRACGSWVSVLFRRQRRGARRSI